MPVNEITTPHYSVVCDECGEAAGSEDYGGWILYESRTEALSEARETWEWRVADDGKVTCSGCLDEERIAAEEASDAA